MRLDSGLLAVSRTPLLQLLDTILIQSQVSVSPDGRYRPDGRPLYLYTLSDETFSVLGQFMEKALAAYHRQRMGHYSVKRPQWLAQCFVLYGAHWFRRRYEGGMQRWADLGILPLDFDTFERGRLVKAGLDVWGIPLFRSEHNREWLHTLALNGGIPAKLLSQKRSGWIHDYFETISSDPRTRFASTFEDFSTVTHDNAASLSERYRAPEIFEQAARLLQIITHWRARCPEGLTPVTATQWLEQAFPDWKSGFPLHVENDPTQMRNLIGRLLTVEFRMADRSLQVERGLRLSREQTQMSWRGCARVHAKGVCAAEDFGLGPGDLGHVLDITSVGRVVGRADVIAGSNGATLLRCTERSTSPVIEADLLENIDVEVERPGHYRRAPTALWRGAPSLTSPVIGFRDLTENWSGVPVHALLGEGSLRTRDSSVLCLVKDDARLERLEDTDTVVDATGQTMAEHVGQPSEELARQDGATLWRVSGGIRIVHGDDVYRITTGSHEDAVETLDVVRMLMDGLRLAEPRRCIAAWPVKARTRSNGFDVPTDQTQLGLSGGPDGMGRQTLTWRDADGFTRARAFLLVLPPDAQLRARQLAHADETPTVRVTWSGLAGWTVSLGSDETDIAPLGHARVGVLDGSGGTVDIVAPADGQIPLTLFDPNGRQTACTLDIELSEPVLRDVSGRVRRGTFDCDTSELDDWVLDLPQPEILSLQLHGEGRAAIFRPLPKGSVRLKEFAPLIESLHACSHERGPSVLISLLNRRRLGQVRRPTASLDAIGATAINRTGRAGQIVFRALVDPEREFAGTETGPDSARIPDALDGFCLAYVRSGLSVTTRPIVIASPRRLFQHPTALGTLSLIEDSGLREDRLKAFLNDGEHEQAADTLAALCRTISSLRGLSPRSIDALRLLPECPDALARMFLLASDDQLPRLIDLESRLPFQWMALPASSWAAALHASLTRLISGLAQVPGIDNPAVQAMEAVTKLGERRRTLCPWFAAHMPNLASPNDLDGLRAMTGPFIDLWRQVSVPAMSSLFDHNQLHRRFNMTATMDVDTNPALLVPLAYAAQSRGVARPDISQRLLMRSALIAAPDFVQGAYVLAMRDADLWKHRSL